MPTTDNLPPKKIKYYIAVRKSEDSNQEFYDYETLSTIPANTNDKICKENKRLPTWAPSNPVQKIASVNIVEIS